MQCGGVQLVIPLERDNLSLCLVLLFLCVVFVCLFVFGVCHTFYLLKDDGDIKKCY